MKKSKSLLLLILIVLLASFLRFYKVDIDPPGLYIDEISIAANASDVLRTGKDEHGVANPVFFKAFGEYKLPVYIYLTSGSIILFGNTDFAVRFPSIIFGIATVLLLYFFVKELLATQAKKQQFTPTQQEVIPLLSAFLLAISPWHLQFSRAGFEANVALFFFLSACFLQLRFWKKQNIWLSIIACLSFIIAAYTYSTYRFLSPFVFLVLSGIFAYKLPTYRKHIGFVFGLFLILSIPMIQFSLSAEGSARFNETSAFSEYPTKTVVDKVVGYPMVYIKNYLSYFSLDYLFIRGDGIGRHQMPWMGLFFRWQLPFLLIGLFWLLRTNRSLFRLTLFSFLLIGPLVPALAIPSPHSLRGLLLVIPYTMLVACGISYACSVAKRYKMLLIIGIILVGSLEGVWYAHLYYYHYPNVNSVDWGESFEPMVKKAVSYQTQYNRIVVDGSFTYSQLYFSYYAPQLHIQYGFDEEKYPIKKTDHVLLIKRPFSKDSLKGKVIDKIYYPGPNKDIFAQFWSL